MPEIVYQKNKRYYYMSINYNYSPKTIEEDVFNSCILDLNILYIIARQKNDAITMKKLESVYENSLASEKEPKLKFKRNTSLSTR